MKRIMLSAAATGLLTATTIAAASAQTVPGGSYQQSCSNVYTNGSVLTAVCTNQYGVPVRTSVNTNGCIADIANVNGQLICRQYAAGYGPGYGYGRGYDRDRDHDYHHDNGRHNGWYHGRGNKHHDEGEDRHRHDEEHDGDR